MTKKRINSIKEYANRLLTKYGDSFDAVDGREIMGMGMCVESAYYEIFGEWFPRSIRGSVLAKMCRCIIDGKPYEP
jgi:hypothetical protein